MKTPFFGRAAAVALTALTFVLFSMAAPNEEHFKTRLAPVAMDVAMRANITGSGTASATLAGNKLTVTGTFAGLVSPATKAQLNLGLAPGVRGPAVFDLTATPAQTGNLTGTFELNPEQIEALLKGRFYVQLSSQKAPEGNLWGWLLISKQETSRK